MKLHFTVFLALTILVGYLVYNKMKFTPLEAAKADFENTLRLNFKEMTGIPTPSPERQQEMTDILLRKLTEIQNEFGVIPTPSNEVMQQAQTGDLTVLPDKLIQKWIPCTSDPMECLMNFMAKSGMQMDM